MKQLINVKDIILNYKQITITTSLIQNFCLKDEFNHLQSTSDFEIPNSNICYKIFKQLHIDYMLLKFPKIIINKNGIYYNIDSIINKILLKYSLNLSDKKIKEKLELVKNQLKKITTKEALMKYSSQLYKKYLKLEKKYLIKNYNPIIKKEKRVILDTILKEEIEVIEYIQNNIENQFKELTECNELLSLIDIDKLKLVVATQIMEYSKKTKAQSAIIYLKEYLSENKHLLETNYQIKKYIRDSLGLESWKIFSIKEIYDYVYPTKITEKEPLSTPTITEKYTYNFLEPKESTPKEILSTYFKLGIASDNEEKLKELLKRKITYYQSLNISKIKIGLNSFDGYLGLCLEDGTVILDKFYDNLEKGKISHDQAIYITDEKEFEKVTILSKTECIEEIKKGKVKAKRIYHQGFWEDKINCHLK